MVRGLDGCFLVRLPHTWPVQFSSSTERLAKFRWCIAKGRHLFPFRTEQLSLSAPMVLGGQPPGRVGRRRFFWTSLSRLRAALRRYWGGSGGLGRDDWGGGGGGGGGWGRDDGRGRAGGLRAGPSLNPSPGWRVELAPGLALGLGV